MRFKSYSLNRAETVRDSYGQLSKGAFQLLRTVRLAVVKDSSNESNLAQASEKELYTAIYHGRYSDFEITDRLNDEYEIISVNQVQNTITLGLKKL